jgi:D-alanyl-D-alanine carboxypeptidase
VPADRQKKPSISKRRNFDVNVRWCPPGQGVYRNYMVQKPLAFALLLLALSLLGSFASAQEPGVPSGDSPLGRPACAQVLKDIQLSHAAVFKSVRSSMRIGAGDRVLLTTSVGAGVTEDTRFLLGSVSKPLLSILLLQRATRGELSIDDLITDDLPSGFEGPQVDPRWLTLRMSQLLNHSSGIVDYLNASAMPAGFLSTPRSYLELLRSVPVRLAFAPSSMLRYSNTNYLILGEILKRRMGKSYGDLLDEQIVRALGLRNTGATIDWDSSLLGTTTVFPANMVGVGNAYSTSADLHRILRALDSDELLPRETVARMFTADPACTGDRCGRYGLGFSLRKGADQLKGGFDWVLHQGHLKTVCSIVAKVPGKELNFALVSDAPNQVPTDDLEVFAKEWLERILASDCV